MSLTFSHTLVYGVIKCRKRHFTNLVSIKFKLKSGQFGSRKMAIPRQSSNYNWHHTLQRHSRQWTVQLIVSTRISPRRQCLGDFAPAVRHWSIRLFGLSIPVSGQFAESLKTELKLTQDLFTFKGRSRFCSNLPIIMVSTVLGIFIKEHHYRTRKNLNSEQFWTVYSSKICPYKLDMF